MAGVGAVVAAVRLRVGLLRLSYGGAAGIVLPEVDPICIGRNERAVITVDLVVTVRLSVLVDVVAGHLGLHVAVLDRLGGYRKLYKKYHDRNTSASIATVVLSSEKHHPDAGVPGCPKSLGRSFETAGWSRD